MSASVRYLHRAAQNDASRNRAENFRQLWTGEEDEFLREQWDGSEETLRTIAEILGRTIEACRQRFYRPAGVTEVRVERITTVTTVERFSICPDCCLVRTPCGACGCS